MNSKSGVFSCDKKRTTCFAVVNMYNPAPQRGYNGELHDLSDSNII